MLVCSCSTMSAERVTVLLLPPPRYCRRRSCTVISSRISPMPRFNTNVLERIVACQCNRSQAIEVTLKHFVTCDCTFSYSKMSQDDMATFLAHEAAYSFGHYLGRISMVSTVILRYEGRVVSILDMRERTKIQCHLNGRATEAINCACRRHDRSY